MTDDSAFEVFNELMRAHPYYDKAGNPITDVLVWGRLFEDMDYRRIGQDVVIMGDEPVNVSTVWLGIEHSWGRGRPVIFETMVFGGPYDQEQMRYCTEAEAEQGHRRVVNDLAAGHAPWWATEVMEDSDDS